MIHQDLSRIEGCPEAGAKVTVDGLNPWNCLLTFGVDAGPVRNRAELQGFCDTITERLKRCTMFGTRTATGCRPDDALGVAQGGQHRVELAVDDVGASRDFAGCDPFLNDGPDEDAQDRQIAVVEVRRRRRTQTTLRNTSLSGPARSSGGCNRLRIDETLQTEGIAHSAGLSDRVRARSQVL